MNIVSKPLPKLTASEYRRCAELTYGPYDGYMHPNLVEHRDNPRARAVLAFQGRVLVGWALLIPSKEVDQMYWMSRHAQRNTKFAVQVYVRHAYRRRGVGTALMKRVHRFDSRPYVWPHDQGSTALFSKGNIACSATSRKDMKYYSRMNAVDKLRPVG